MYGSYGLDTMRATPAVTTGVWTIVAFVLALVGAFVAYFLFVKPEKKYPNKFVTWLRNFLNFQEMLIEPILKVTYLSSTIVPSFFLYPLWYSSSIKNMESGR